MATQPRHSFEPFNTARLKATRKAWDADVASGFAFPTEIDRLFDWVATHQEPCEDDAIAYGVFAKGSDVALGVCEVIIQRKSIRSKWIKMLKLTLKPDLDVKLQGGDADGAMMVFTESIVGSIDLQSTHLANILKVYGRTPDQLNFLKVLVRHLQNKTSGKNAPYKATIEGRFLSIVVS